ncbi:uncharacterized protein F4812DRAFT_39322 [Daldinia caldariorum]|uniref:uncharacterized protein n=1 Tax=Daldinia caldariorum TaxID=326644 RepID=UPI002007A34B|nr:uncharacterized protein F4812DRAFT_39322 [Daldinia caldariorum]KAI1473099.1 hypothetical protein F4812DRAFT_39322 [Daldinia caldariorum]
MPEDLSPGKTGNRHLSDRISRVEDIVKDFLADKDGGGTIQVGEEIRQDRCSKSNNPAPSSSFPIPLTPVKGVLDKPENEIVLHHLLKAFPSEEDTSILLRGSAIPSLYIDVLNTQPHSKQTLEALTKPLFTGEVPSFTAHPAVVARYLLVFAITLQTPSSESLFGLSEPHDVLMRRLTTAARMWVTTNEEMHGTVECLVCIILEGIFETNCGNLRRAWAVYRRAITVAQLMGFHRSPIPAYKLIDPKLNVDPKFMWFRIVYMDRYLSLLLGLPQGTSDRSIGVPSVLRHEPPMGHFERALTAIASRILERNESTFVASEIATTLSIDSDLLSVSKSMPASFWRPANFHNITLGSPESVLEITRLAAQVYYYGLVIQLHLPYMMRLGGNTEHEYSKVACVNASREIMTRFISHRSFNPRSSCSRPVDFFALLAAMTLLLAHLDAHHRREATNFLAHQRLGDRAMLEEALEKMDGVTKLSKDSITEKSAGLIRRLLHIEADAANGSSYITRSEGVEQNAEEGMNINEELRLRIPYVGVIKIGRQGYTSLTDPRELGQMDTHLEAPEFEQSMPEIFSPNQDNNIPHPHTGTSPIMDGVNDWGFQGVDMAFFDNLMRGTSFLDATRLEQ